MIEAINLQNLGTVNKNQVEVVRRFDKTAEGHFGTNALLYFSYRTIVAVRSYDGEMFVGENDWSNTTGKLLNELQPDKSLRVSHDKVMAEATKVFRGAIHINP